MTAVAIDGPAGAGKSTVARAVADELGWTYVDSGAMYRAVALAVLDAGADPSDDGAVEGVLDGLDIDNDGVVTRLNGIDVSQRIRTPDVTAAAAAVARNRRVRQVLGELQRRAATRRNSVMEGRDIATHVLPDAEIKVFLTASLDERARRRAHDLGVAGGGVASVRADIAERDARDTTRTEAPLRRADGATEIDTTGRSIADVVAEIVALVRTVTA